MSSPSIRCCTAAEAPRARRGSSSEDESEEELGGRLEDTFRRGETTRTGAFFGAGTLAAALPFGLPRGRFTGTSDSADASPAGASTDCARTNASGGGGSSAVVEASSAFSGASIGSRFTSILFNDFFLITQQLVRERITAQNSRAPRADKRGRRKSLGQPHQ